MNSIVLLDGNLMIIIICNRNYIDYMLNTNNRLTTKINSADTSIF